MPCHTLSPTSPYYLPTTLPTLFPSLLSPSPLLPVPPRGLLLLARYHFPPFLVPGLSTARGYGLAFQAGSPNVTDFSLAILRLNEQGFLGKLTRKWWDNTNNCPMEQTTSK